MQTTNSFRQCLHPTPFGFALGILVMAFSLGLWVWLIAQLATSPDASKQLRRTAPSPAQKVCASSRPCWWP